MRIATLAGLIVVGAALAACGSEPPAEPERAARRPPQPACEQAQATLERRSRGGAFLFERTGAAMIDLEEWLSMGRSSQDRLIDTLAVLAGCSAPTPQREVEVTIRSQTGVVLASRQVRPSTDFRAGGNSPP